MSSINRHEDPSKEVNKFLEQVLKFQKKFKRKELREKNPLIELSEGEDFEGDEEELIPAIMKPYLKV